MIKKQIIQKYYLKKQLPDFIIYVENENKRGINNEQALYFNSSAY